MTDPRMKPNRSVDAEWYKTQELERVERMRRMVASASGSRHELAPWDDVRAVLAVMRMMLRALNAEVVFSGSYVTAAPWVDQVKGLAGKPLSRIYKPGQEPSEIFDPLAGERVGEWPAWMMDVPMSVRQGGVVQPGLMNLSNHWGVFCEHYGAAPGIQSKFAVNETISEPGRYGMVFHEWQAVIRYPPVANGEALHLMVSGWCGTPTPRLSFRMRKSLLFAIFIEMVATGRIGNPCLSDPGWIVG